ncbi:MAG: CBS domain-containing protein [bacterium]|nr:CBS domain-containing protein [Myxococcales bacterium]MCB9552324.1 CBS domain-containing protein [Myxococcales bacterium]
MKVRDVMTPDPIAIRSDRTIRDALETLEKHHIRHLPILEDGRLSGILSDRSVAPWRQTLFDAESWHDVDLEALLMQTRVADIVERRVVSIDPDAPVSAAIDALLDHNIGAVPVVDDRDELVGIVSYVDLLRAMRSLVD